MYVIFGSNTALYTTADIASDSEAFRKDFVKRSLLVEFIDVQDSRHNQLMGNGHAHESRMLPRKYITMDFPCGYCQNKLL